MQAVLNYILSLGAAIFLPVIMILLGLLMKMKPKRAIIAGLTLGVAFTGMNVVLGFMFNAISPAAAALVKRTGLELTAIDVGWSPIAAIAWAWPYALVLFPIQIIINLIMLGFKWTNCLNVDLWNVWGKIFVASMVSYLTGSLMLGYAAAAIQIILELINADLIQKQLNHISNIPGVTCTHPMALQSAFLALLNRILDFIPGINQINLNAKELKDKLGIFGENSIMGFIVGALIALMGGYAVKAVLTTAVQVATSLVLFPMVAKLFMQALAPIADATSSYMKSKFKGRDFYVGLDWPFLAGQNEIWVTAIVLVPFELVLALVMSKMGMNNVIPLASIINVCVAVPALIVTGGNLFRMILISIIATPMYLAVATSFAPMITKMAASTGTLQVHAGQFITWIQLEAPEFRWSLVHAFNGEMLGIAALAGFGILFVWYYNYMKNLNKKLDEVKSH
ncbi:phosphotransferase system sugar-specific permease component [Lucifera butyrica]|uniref:Phosphotransferase system sugar-specific permease component n=1 Tax=Lucifera butyrica TaxID=1351585 RepID=A0A498R9X8_9FIRM|nr:PTS transporter subunit IIC [Lucifera butyrica]VBB07757.1 phosphotransferase system sugar-specific permease component [Lucifera butyrica]